MLHRVSFGQAECQLCLPCIVHMHDLPYLPSLAVAQDAVLLCLAQSAHMLSLQVVIGVGLLAAVSYAVKQFVAPKVSQWYHEWRPG